MGHVIMGQCQSFAAQTYEHNFENRTLFYRFHLDSISSIRDGAAPSNSWCDVLFDSLCAPAPQSALPAHSVYETLHEPRPLDLHAQCLCMSIEHCTATDARLLTPVRQLEAYFSLCQATGSEVVILRSLSCPQSLCTRYVLASWHAPSVAVPLQGPAWRGDRRGVFAGWGGVTTAAARAGPLAGTGVAAGS